jgi:hypothetical protein
MDRGRGRGEFADLTPDTNSHASDTGHNSHSGTIVRCVVDGRGVPVGPQWPPP